MHSAWMLQVAAYHVHPASCWNVHGFHKKLEHWVKQAMNISEAAATMPLRTHMVLIKRTNPEYFGCNCGADSGTSWCVDRSMECTNMPSACLSRIDAGAAPARHRYPGQPDGRSSASGMSSVFLFFIGRDEMMKDVA